MLSRVIVDHLRTYGPMSGPELTAQLGLSYGQAARALMTARYNKLIAIVGKTATGALIFGAVQTHEWPGRAA